MPSESTDSKQVVKNFELPSESVVGKRLESDAYWREKSKIENCGHNIAISKDEAMKQIELDIWLHTEY